MGALWVPLGVDRQALAPLAELGARGALARAAHGAVEAVGDRHLSKVWVSMYTCCALEKCCAHTPHTLRTLCMYM